MMRSTDRPAWGWWMAVAIVLVAALGVRWSADLSTTTPIFDEQYIIVPINTIIEKGWSVQTAIDFEETKGPAMIWPYAAFGRLVGGDLPTLRMLSVIFFVLSILPLLMLARWAGCSPWQTVAVGVGYVLLPYQLVMGQLVMSEASFVFGAMWLALFFLWGFGRRPAESHRILGPVLFGLLLAVLLHNRIHIVAFAGAACAMATWRDGKASWPWWVASIGAGLLRVPLWVRWEGLVSPEYANLHGLGFRLESMTYLAAALAPLVAVFLVQWWFGRRRFKWLVWIAGVAGILLTLLAMPDLTVPATAEVDLNSAHDRFQGIAATTALKVAGVLGGGSQAVLGLMAGAGLAGLAALAALAMDRDGDRAGGTIAAYAAWVLLVGWALYAMTRGFVFDRFLLGWAVVLPVCWARLLHPRLLAVQLLALLVIAGRLGWIWLW